MSFWRCRRSTPYLLSVTGFCFCGGSPPEQTAPIPQMRDSGKRILNAFEDTSGDADIEDMRGWPALPFAFFGALAWFLWTTTGQSTGSCFSYGHYLPSAAIAFIVIASVSVVTDLFVMSRGQRPTLNALAITMLAAGFLTGLGLAAAVFFSGVLSCSGG